MNFSITMRAVMAGTGLATAGTSFGQNITGAGASFPAPIYSKWADAYNKATQQHVNYQSVGSGAGIKQIKSKTVDFGASDMPLTDEELAKGELVEDLDPITERRAAIPQPQCLDQRLAWGHADLPRHVALPPPDHPTGSKLREATGQRR